MSYSTWKIVLGVLILTWFTRGEVMAFEISSSAFDEGAVIPVEYTCDGSDRSPGLTWRGIPREAKSLVLVSDDPDAPAGSWVHWVMYNIPVEAAGLPEGVPPEEIVERGAAQGRNDFGRIGYGGPCPPPGKPHRYFFRLFALDADLKLPPGLRRSEVMEKVESHILTETQVMGYYSRNR